MIDMVEGNAAADLRRWCAGQDPAWLSASGSWPPTWPRATGPALHPHLDHARRVADPFHVVGVANRCVDQVRRRVQNETLGHRGRKHDPLYRIRRVLFTGSERLDQRGHDRMVLGLRLGDPNDEVLGAWLAKEYVRDIYLTDDPSRRPSPRQGHRRLCRRSRRDPEPRRHLAAWRKEIFTHHRTGASNGPTEARTSA